VSAVRQPSAWEVLAIQALIDRAEELLEAGENSLGLTMVMVSLIDREEQVVHVDSDLQDRYSVALIAWRELERG
jgi:hypothetical protein